jgi:hypothetical protein
LIYLKSHASFGSSLQRGRKPEWGARVRPWMVQSLAWTLAGIGLLAIVSMLL